MKGGRGREGEGEGGREGGSLAGVGRGGREGDGAELANRGGVEVRRLRVKVAGYSRGNAALIPCGSKSVLSN